ncbi:hypothetical protein PWT90_00744 [Aphanocladium album]|nr:hypothetical protein PWT90_00744 [Aphanocladium album]
MRCQFLSLLAAVGVAALPAANDYDYCQRDDLYKSLKQDGEDFCSMLLDPECYTTINTPIEYATYDAGKLSSYCSCIYEPCHHDTTSSVAVPLPTTGTDTTSAQSSSVSLSPQNSTSFPLPDSLPTQTPAPGPPWSAANTTLLTPTTSTPLGNVTITIIPAPTSSGTGISTLTIIPGNSTSSQGTNATSTAATIVTTTTAIKATATPTPFLAANFTGVLRGPAPDSQACHYLPAALVGAAHAATLQNEEIRQRNLSLAFPYVGSVSFDSDDVRPLYLSVRDAAKGSHLIDVSDSSAVTIFDAKNNSLRLDVSGIHFVTGNCNLTVSYLIDNMYTQLAQQSRETCSLGPKTLLAGDQTFLQPLVLRDQCGDPVGPMVRKYPDLRLDGEQCVCVGAADANGTWTFSCPWQTSGSTVQRCVSSLQRNVVQFLLYDPFNGGCADVSSVVTLLEASAQDMFNATSLQEELYRQVGNNTNLFYKADDTVMYYMQLWESLKSSLSKTRGLNPGRGSNVKQYLDTYNSYRSFAADACMSLNSSSAPAVLSLSAGSSNIPMLASLSEIPAPGSVLTAIIQDPAKIACCPHGGLAVTGPANGTCSYPAEALVPGTGCICGKTASQQSVAFKYRQCDNFVSQCQTDSDCTTAGYAGHLCLIGSCCGKGVCFDPFECSRPEVLLLPGSG